MSVGRLIIRSYFRQQSPESSALDAAVEAVGALDWDSLPVLERLEALEHLETARRKQMACSYDITPRPG